LYLFGQRHPRGLSGVLGASELPNVLAKLDVRQQALFPGHTVPIPVVNRTRDTTLAAYCEALGYTPHFPDRLAHGA
jgi:hypothetical protein